jgi:hypothetical protein
MATAETTFRGDEYGNFYDCLEEFTKLVKRLASGDVVEAATKLGQLLEYITMRGDPKSYAWLRPAILSALGRKV